MKQDKQFLKYDLVKITYLHENERVYTFGRVIRNTIKTLYIDISMPCRSIVSSIKWKEVIDIRKAKYFELSEI